MASGPSRTILLAAGLTVVTLTGCSNYIKRDEFDSTIAELRATDQRMQQQLDTLSQKHDALVTQLAGRTRVETGAHFASGDSALSDQDKPLLDDFARVVRGSHSEAVITVEGFADPAGSTAFNKRLGQRRADAVRDYLVTSGGLNGANVRAVSYGEDRNRQVRSGAIGEAGRDNRRVALVVDYAGPMAAPAAQPTASVTP